MPASSTGGTGSATAGSGAIAVSAGRAGGGAGTTSAVAGSAGALGTGGPTAGVGSMTAAGTGGPTAGVGPVTAAGAGTAGMGAAGSGGGAGRTGGAKDADCDMNGLWASRMLTVTDALSADQCASIYAFYELKHDGTNVEVVNHFDCGLTARGSATASYSSATRTALLMNNSQIGRKGTMSKAADGTCQFEMEPFWYVLGAEASFAPTPRNSPTSLGDLQRMKPFPMATGAAGIVDLENDGRPGYATIVSESAVTGTRHGVVRNTHTWKTDDFYKIMPSMTWDKDIEARNVYFGEEYALEAENPFLLSLATPVPLSAAARVTLHFMGRDASDPRAQQTVMSANPADPAGALKTCDSIFAALPRIDPIYGLEQRCPCPNGKASDTARKCVP